jgi:Ricin-type beta-trefoil lectin domain-like
VPGPSQGLPHAAAADPHAYSCAAGYNLPAVKQTGGYSDYELQNDSTGTVAPEEAWALNDQTVPADSIVYSDPNRNGGTGQVMLECDPGQLSGYPSTNPGTNPISIAKVGALTTQEVEVNQSDQPSANGGVVDTWQQVAAGSRPVSNELWAYVPDTEAVGYGQLVSQSSGKCLEVNGTTGVVDQWTCVPEAANELWHVSTNSSFSGFGAGFSLQVLSTGKYLGVNPSSQNEYINGTWYDPGWVNGTPLAMMSSPSQATAWTWGN